jgi:hypothetical protein
MKRSGILAVLALALVAPVAMAQDTLSAATLGDLPPVGLGTLGQDDIALTFRQEELEIRVVPLDERLLRLLAPDSYRSLHEITRIRGPQIDSVSRTFGVATPGLFLVTFFGRRAGARFDPQNINLIVRNQLYRPIGQVAYSTNFNSQQLEQRQQATGIILFEGRIPIFEPFQVSYGATVTDAWEGKLTRISRERTRVLGKTRGDTTRFASDTTNQ